MAWLAKLFDLFRPKPEEQVLGYSLEQLKAVFDRALPSAPGSSRLALNSLASTGVAAWYVECVVDLQERQRLLQIVERECVEVDQASHNGLAVVRYRSESGDALVLCMSDREFNALTVRMLTNSVAFLTQLNDARLSVPPPWVVFKDFPAEWWGGNMQGAQAYYDERYFSPYFNALSDAEKSRYFEAYAASPAWIRQLALWHDDD